MKPPELNVVKWLTGYSAWAFYCAVVSLFGVTAYYADLLRLLVPDWIGLGLLIAPIVVIVFIQYGEAPDRFVAATHILVAAWFMTLAVGMEVGHWLGYSPRGTLFYRVLAHLGWTFAGLGFTGAPGHFPRRRSSHLIPDE